MGIRLDDFHEGLFKGIANDLEYIKRQLDDIARELRKIQKQLLHRPEK